MRHLALFHLLLYVGTAAADPPVDVPANPFGPAPAATKAGPTSPPVIDGPAEAKYLLTLTVANLPPDAGVLWDVSPDGKAEVKEADCDGALTIAGPAGAYTVKARVVRWDAAAKRIRTTTLTKAVRLTGGKVDPGPDPRPDPQPDPTPDPEPEPKGKVARFVVVEDTLKAAAWRGDILGSPEVAAFYKAQQLTHRLIDVNIGPDELDPAAKQWAEKAAGKDLPWLFALDAAGGVVRSEKVRPTPREFVAQLGGQGEHARRMGNNAPPQNKTRGVFPLFGSAPRVPLIPRDKWKPVNLSAFLPPVYDQDGVGACNAFASVTAFEAARKQAGLPYVAVSPGFLYGAINGGVDQGSFLEDGMEWMSTKGTVKVTTVGYLDWRRGRSLMANAAALAEAKHYRAVEVYECPTFDGIASALQQGFFIVEGLMWFDNFTPDRDGWLPGRGAGGMGGHALAGYGLAQRGGAWGIRTRNSWSAGWGVGGDCVIPESLFDNRIGGFWAVRAVQQTAARDAAERFDRVFALAF